MNHPQLPTLRTGRRSLLATAALVLLAAGGLSCMATAATVPPPAIDVASAPASTSETAVLAGGCFWGVQGVFQHVQGVISAVSGYAGGKPETANYDQVSAGGTGHAEAVRIVYDPAKISYGRLLQIYFSVAHNPTELNFQGPDSGTQYRSTIFAANPEQARVAQAYIAQLNTANTFGRKLATTVEQGRVFHTAEAHHQDYMTLHPAQPYILIHDRPKVANLKKVFPALYREKPVLVGAK